MYFDLACLIFLTLSISLGAINGIILSVISSSIVIASIVISIITFKYTQPFFIKIFGDSMTNHVLNLILSITVYLLSTYVIKKTFNSACINNNKISEGLNMIIGAVFGLVRGVIIICIIFSMTLIVKLSYIKSNNMKEMLNLAPPHKKCIESSTIFGPMCCEVFILIHQTIGQENTNKLLEKIPTIKWKPTKHKALN